MSSPYQGVKMRFGGSPIISVILCAITLILLYLYWAKNGQLRAAQENAISLKEEMKVLEDEKDRLSGRLTILASDLQKENRMKRTIETNARSLKSQLDEAQSKLQSANARVTEIEKSQETIQQQLDTKSEENEHLAEESFSKQTQLEDCIKQKEELSSQYNSQSNKAEQDKSSLQQQILQLQTDVSSMNGQLLAEQEKTKSLQSQLYHCQSSLEQRQQPHTQQDTGPPRYQQPRVYQSNSQTNVQRPYQGNPQGGSFTQQRYGKEVFHRADQGQEQRQLQFGTRNAGQSDNSFNSWEKHVIEDGRPSFRLDSMNRQQSRTAPNPIRPSSESVPETGQTNVRRTPQEMGEPPHDNVQGQKQEGRYEDGEPQGPDLLPGGADKKEEEEHEYDDQKGDDADIPANQGDDNEGGPLDTDDYGNNGGGIGNSKGQNNEGGPLDTDDYGNNGGDIGNSKEQNNDKGGDNGDIGDDKENVDIAGDKGDNDDDNGVDKGDNGDIGDDKEIADIAGDKSDDDENGDDKDDNGEDKGANDDDNGDDGIDKETVDLNDVGGANNAEKRDLEDLANDQGDNDREEDGGDYQQIGVKETMNENGAEEKQEGNYQLSDPNQLERGRRFAREQDIENNLQSDTVAQMNRFAGWPDKERGNPFNHDRDQRPQDIDQMRRLPNVNEEDQDSLVAPKVYGNDGERPRRTSRYGQMPGMNPQRDFKTFRRRQEQL